MSLQICSSLGSKAHLTSLPYLDKICCDNCTIGKGGASHRCFPKPHLCSPCNQLGMDSWFSQLALPIVKALFYKLEQNLSSPTVLYLGKDFLLTTMTWEQDKRDSYQLHPTLQHRKVCGRRVRNPGLLLFLDKPLVPDWNLG